jgi:hypothetical protein
VEFWRDGGGVESSKKWRFSGCFCEEYDAGGSGDGRETASLLGADVGQGRSKPVPEA